jgi:hypothetical protein
VRLNPPLTILALVGVCLIALSVKRQAEFVKLAEVRRTQCDVALTHLKNIYADNAKLISDEPLPLLLLETPEQVASMEQIALAVAQNPRFKNHPDIEIEILKSKIAELSPIKLCRKIKNWAVEKQVRIEPGGQRHKDAAEPDWLTINRDNSYDWQIIQVSMPVISANGKSAYLNESSYFGPLAGGAEALEYKISPNGAWELVQRVGLYVS